MRPRVAGGAALRTLPSADTVKYVLAIVVNILRGHMVY